MYVIVNEAGSETQHQGGEMGEWPEEWLLTQVDDDDHLNSNQWHEKGLKKWDDRWRDDEVLWVYWQSKTADTASWRRFYHLLDAQLTDVVYK